MILALAQLGEHLSHDRNEWTDIIDLPKTDQKKENFVVGIIFNIDDHTISLDEVSAYSNSSPHIFKNLKIKGGNNKATYVCCEPDKMIQIEKTFFGKMDNKGTAPVKGEFKEYIDNKFPELKISLLYQVLDALFNLRDKYIAEHWSMYDTIYTQAFSGSKESIARSKLVLIYGSVIAKSLGIENPTLISQLNGYEEFIRLDRFAKQESREKRISYATGASSENVNSVSFPNRYSINYMFVETTLNYAVGFNKSNFNKNYQISTKEQLYLERASKYLLENQQIKIAGLPHCIIPQFLSKKK